MVNKVILKNLKKNVFSFYLMYKNICPLKL